ncbi:MAG: serine/threonine protein kinase [Planctomycetota bacterium]
MDPGNLVGVVVGDRYELLESLGRGAHGTVCRAVDRQTGEPVAVKVLNEGAAKDPGQVERLAREQQALLAVSGTSAVRVLDLCATSRGVPCLVMEMLDGQDLGQYLEARESANRPLEKERLAEILSPIVDTLQRAHAVGVIHRDLKPANVFLLSEQSGGGVRLLDFGLARLASADPLTATGIVMGTPSYIAPEIWMKGSRNVERRADLYSLAVIMYRALTGRLPFGGEDMVETYKLVIQGERPGLRALRPDLPHEVDDWTRKALAIDPDDRFQSARDLWNTWLSASGTPRPSPLKVFAKAVRAPALVTAWRNASAALRRMRGSSRHKEVDSPAPTPVVVPPVVDPRHPRHPRPWSFRRWSTHRHPRPRSFRRWSRRRTLPSRRRRRNHVVSCEKVAWSSCRNRSWRRSRVRSPLPRPRR